MNNFFCNNNVAQLLAPQFQVKVFESTWNRLYVLGLYSRRPMVYVSLKARHYIARREWGKSMPSGEDINEIMSSSSTVPVFIVYLDNRHILICENVELETILHSYKKVSNLEKGNYDLGWIFINVRTDFHIINNPSLMVQKYTDDILFILLNENFRCLYAGIVNNFLYDERLIQKV